MKKSLAFVLSLMLIFTSAVPAMADEISSESSSVIVESGDNGEDGSEDANDSDSSADETGKVPSDEGADGGGNGTGTGEDQTETGERGTTEDGMDSSEAWQDGPVIEETDPTEDVLPNAAVVLVDGGTYIIRSAAAPNYVLDVTGNNTEIRTNIQLHKYNSTNAEKWYAHANSNGSYTFISCSSGRALDLEGNNAAGGSNIQLYTANFESGQKWALEPAGSNAYYISHAQSGCHMAVAGASYVNGTNIYLETASTADNQKFIFEQVEPEDHTGTYVITARDNKSRVIGALTSAGTFALQDRTNKDDQLYSIQKASSFGYYTVTNKATGKKVGIQASGKDNRPITASSSGDDTLMWHIVKNDDGSYVFFNKAVPHVCLQITSTETGAGVVSGYYSKQETQNFRLVDPNKGTYSGTYVVRSVKYPDRVLDVESGNTASGANIQSYNNNWSEAQQYTFERAEASNDAVYYIINQKSKCALTVSGTVQNDANVVQETLSRKASQKWVVKGNSDGSISISPYSNTALTLDIASGSIAYKANVRIHRANSTAAQKWYLSSNRITTCELANASTLNVSGAAYDSTVVGDDGKLYLFALDPTDYTIGNSTPIASATEKSQFTLKVSNFSRENYINRQFFTGILLDGRYRINSNGMYITNPETAAKKTFARTEPYNKKGLAIYWSQDKVQEAINTLHVKNVALNLPLINLLSGSGASYNYKGKTYYFNSTVSTYYKDRVRELTSAGVNVTCIVYADSGMFGAYAEYITPGGRRQNGEALLYGMNAQETVPRDKLEAAFAFLCDTFSDSNAHVDNWVIGNEIDDPVSWNYCGDNLPIDQYATLYAQVYRLAFNTMSGIWKNVRVYNSLDHVWTTNRGSRYYTAKDITDQLNKILKDEGDIDWHMAFHPYCSPEQDPRFWRGGSYGLNHDGNTTPTISMYNLDALTNYVSSKYGSEHHIILSETGMSARYQGVTMENEQAAALAYAYYLSEYNNGVDNYIHHCYMDTEGETAGGWYLGLRRADGSPRPSYTVMGAMDSLNNGLTVTQSQKYGGKALVAYVNGAKSWSSLIAGFDIKKFGDSRY